MATKNLPSRFFEDYRLGQKITHALPRQVTVADQSAYIAFTGSRFALHSAAAFGQKLGYPQMPLDDILVFHMVFGRTVPDLSLNALANLGYADCRFLKPVFSADTLNAESEVVGLRENSNRKTGIVYVRSVGRNQKGEQVLSYYRWLMMKKRREESPPPEPKVPQLPARVETRNLYLPRWLKAENWDCAASGSDALWEDYEVGEEIHHLDGQTIEEAEHQLATRLYQNNARVHFNQHIEAKGRFKRRIIYGGIIISLARAISANGLANAFRVAAINGGRHTAPSFAGDTIYAWSKIIEKYSLDHPQLGALRVRTIAAKNDDTMAFPGEGQEPPTSMVLDLDYTVLMAKRRK